MTIPRTIVAVAEFAPIIAFTYLADLSLRQRFAIAGSMALIVLVSYRIMKWPTNSLGLSVNFFLLIEGIAFITSIAYMAPVADVLIFFKESAVFVVTFMVGTVRTIASPKGFLDLEGGNPSVIKRSSIFMLLGTCVAFGISMAFQGRVMLSASLPFLGLLLLQRVLREIASRKGS
jgi:hypothetical protein